MTIEAHMQANGQWRATRHTLEGWGGNAKDAVADLLEQEKSESPRQERAAPQPETEQMVTVPRRLIWQAFNALDEVDYENDPPDRILAVMTELRAAKDASPVLPEAPKE